MKLQKLNIADFIVLGWWLSDLCAQLPSFAYVSLTNKIIWLILVLSIGCVLPIFNKEKYNPPFIRGFVSFYIVVLVYGLFHFLFGESTYYVSLDRVVRNSESLVGVVISLTPFFLCYYLGCRDLITIKRIRTWSILFLINAVVAYFSMRVQVFTISDVESFTNNTAYSFVALLPFVYFWKDKWIFYYLYQIIILYFVILSHKRGALLITILICAYYLYITLKYIRSINILQRLLIVVAACFVVYFAKDLIVSDENLMNRISSGDSSGRDYIFNTLLTFWLESTSWIHILFGYGADYTVRVAGNFAHNDWLELLTCQGILGVILYLYYFYSYIDSYVRCHDSFIKVELIAILIIIFLSSIYSMSYMGYKAPLLICLGFSMSKVRNEMR